MLLQTTALLPCFTIQGKWHIFIHAIIGIGSCMEIYYLLHPHSFWVLIYCWIWAGLVHQNLSSLWPSTIKRFAVTKYLLACDSAWCLKLRNQGQEGSVDPFYVHVLLSVCSEITRDLTFVRTSSIRISIFGIWRFQIYALFQAYLVRYKTSRAYFRNSAFF